MELISALLPKPTEWMVPWQEAEQFLGSLGEQMRLTLQNPRWHGEGDVLTHTRMVCEEMAKSPAFRAADEETRCMLYMSALLHDTGKPRTTRLENGQWTSPGHARVSAQLSRVMLWRELGLCGTFKKQQLRETICALVRSHGQPPYAIDNGKRRLIRTAADGELIKPFTIKLLCTLSQADARGKICDDLEDMLERLALCEELAKEAEVYEQPFPFPSEHTEFAYLSGRRVAPDYPLYDDTWGEVIMMSGLPGTGKDTWIREKYPDLPMISLDEIRSQLGISPAENQSRVADTAHGRAKELLRQKRRFVWNATNISQTTRQQLVELFTGYGASVRIVYLETEWNEQLRRNGERANPVPESAICDMLDKLTVPQRFEAHRVEWHCV